MMLAATSGIKGRPDLLKYEKARKLNGPLIQSIRKDYESKYVARGIRPWLRHSLGVSQGFLWFYRISYDFA